MLNYLLPRNGNNGCGTSNGSGPEVFEADQYFYHPDHLGSSSYVTDIDGEIFQHLEYFPFGETWVEESSNTQRTPYLFTGKELDEETGLYYFGARYYDPRTSVWQSPDPILASYLPNSSQKADDLLALPGFGGISEPLNLSVYAFSHYRPTVLVDPDGKSPASAIALIHQNREAILDSAARYRVDPQGLASIIFQEKYHGIFAAGKNLLALGGNMVTGPVMQPNEGSSYGLSEVQLGHVKNYARETGRGEVSNWEAFSLTQDNATSIDIAAWLISKNQESNEMAFSGNLAGYAHNLSADGFRTYLRGDTDVNTSVPSRSENFQNAIGYALKGRYLPFHDWFFQNPQACSGASCLPEPIYGD